MPTFPRHTSRRHRVPVVALALPLALAGCSGGDDPRAASQVRQQYTELLLDGIPFATSGYARAAGYSPRTGELNDVSIDFGGRLMTARRAIVLVDSVSDTVSLRLFDVTSADPEAGGLEQRAEMILGPVHLGVDVVERADTIPVLDIPADPG